MDIRLAIQVTAGVTGNWNEALVSNVSDSSVMIADAIDYDTGSVTGVEIYTDDDGFNYSFTDGVNSIPSGDAAWVDQAVISDEGLRFTYSPDIEYKGLDPAKTYAVQVYGSVDNSDTATTTLTVDGVTDTLLPSGNSTAIMGVTGVSPNGSGTIFVGLSTSSAGMGRLNAIRVFEEAAGPDLTARKGSTFTVTHGLGTAPDSVTINALACTITNATTTTVDVTVDAAITTSGEYDMVIEDTVAVTSETQTVQVNVVGLPAYTLNKDGSALGNLTGVKAVVTATGEIDGTELYSANDLTATAGVMDSGIYPATGEDGDAVTVSILTGAGEGITFNDALELL